MARQRGVHLYQRDLRIFEHLLERRLDTLGALHERFFDGAARKTARNRLAELAADGYLRRATVQHAPDTFLREADRDRQHLSVYSLTPRGVAALRLRSLAGSALGPRQVRTDLPETSVLHQLAVNRVGDTLGARITCEHLIQSSPRQGRHRPDAVYQSAPDAEGRTAVLLEVDLGHYSRQRVLGKLTTFLADPEAKGILLVAPTLERAAWIARVIRSAHGERIMDRAQVLSFDQLAAGGMLTPHLAPGAGASGAHDREVFAALPRAA